VKRLIVVALFLEVGFLLLVVPWSAFWERNYFAQALPAVRELITNNFVRGAVSGLGLVNIYHGFAELIAIVVARHSSSPSSTFGPSSITPRD
jgi:hypothetical protein